MHILRGPVNSAKAGQHYYSAECYTILILYNNFWHLFDNSLIGPVCLEVSGMRAEVSC